jgi:hypothetical protein
MGRLCGWLILVSTPRLLMFGKSIVYQEQNKMVEKIPLIGMG